MNSSSFSLRQIAYFYCRGVVQLFRFRHFDLYQIGLTCVLLAALCSIAFLASGRAEAPVKRFCPPWLYCLLLMFALFAARLPTFLPRMMNVDEGMFVVGAMKLRHYPVFWQSVDGTTSGPLNFYPLTLLNILGLPLDFATARLLNVICIGGAIAVVYRIARLFMPDWAARLAPLAPLAAAMAFRGYDFLHYSSECVSVLLIAIGTWLLFTESLANHANWLRGAGIGLIVVLLPLAKLQAAPMAAAIAVGGIANAFFWHRGDAGRRLLYILAGLAAGITTLLLFLVGFGVFGTFQQAYIAENILHANVFEPPTFEHFVKFFLSQDLVWYESGILASLIYVLASSYYLETRRKGSGKASSAIPGRPFCDLFAVLLLAASLYAVCRPRSLFLHYLVFLLFPVALVGVRTLAWSLRVSGNADHAGSSLPAVRPAMLFVAFTLVLPYLIRAKELRPPDTTEMDMAASPARLPCEVCPLVERFARPDDLITIWGRGEELYVLSGTLPATRDTHMPVEFWTHPQQDYYRRRYLEDLQLHPPKLFLDAVGPRRFLISRDTFGFETFPELREYVTNNFYLAGDTDGVRVFARRDAAGPFDHSSNLK